MGRTWRLVPLTIGSKEHLPRKFCTESARTKRRSAGKRRDRHSRRASSREPERPMGRTSRLIRLAVGSTDPLRPTWSSEDVDHRRCPAGKRLIRRDSSRNLTPPASQAPSSARGRPICGSWPGPDGSATPQDAPSQVGPRGAAVTRLDRTGGRHGASGAQSALRRFASVAREIGRCARVPSRFGPRDRT